MFGRRTLITAVVVYLLVIVCTLWPSHTVGTSALQAAPQLAALNGLPYCGCSMEIHDGNNVAGYEKCCDDIASFGGDTVLFVPSAAMETANSTTIYIDARHTLTDAQWRELIGHAKADKLRVILMPIVLLDKPKSETDWRGTIHPDDWDDWFSSYQDMEVYYARLAEMTGVNVLVIGSELVSSENFVKDWRTTIRKVRDEFHGQLTYSSNWDHYAMVQFWDDLDLVGMNSYWKLGPDEDPSVPVEEIDRRWTKIQKDVLAWQEQVHKPILLLEAGWCSLANASYEPWDYTRTDLAADVDLQQRLYQGFFESWWGKRQLGGFLLWDAWTPDPGGAQDKGYSLRGKPAADVMKSWFARQRWAVN